MAKKTLEQVRTLFEASVTSFTYRAWLERGKLCRQFFDGIQWTDEELTALYDRGQVPVVINKIRNRVKGLSGTEVVNRTRVGYGPRSMKPEDEATADALTRLALYVQDKGNIAHHRSKMFEDSLVEGAGGLLTETFEQEITSRRISPPDMFWDMSDTTPDLSDSAFRGHKYWHNAENLIAIFPKKKSDLMNMVGMSDDHPFPAQLPQMATTNSTVDYIDEAGRVNYSDKSRGRILVAEVEYRQLEQAYEYVDNQGRLILTFDEKEAKKNRITADEARQQGFYGLVFRELLAYRYYTCQFTGDIELYHAPSVLNYKPDYDLQILCVDKTETDNVPAGLVWWAIDPQKELNKRRSKMLHHLNTVRIIMDSDAVENPELIRQEAARPDAVIVKKKGSDLKVEATTDMAKGQFDVMNLADREIQDTLGIYDELLGKETNAVSGVAIDKRQKNSIRQQAPQFDNFKLATKKYGELLLAYIQSTFIDEQVITIIDDDGLAASIVLNAPQRDAEGQIVNDSRGKPLMVNDIRAGRFDVYVKETLDVASFSEDSLERLSQMLMNGVQPSALTLMAAGFTERQAAELMKKAAPQQQANVLPSPADAAGGQTPMPQG